MRGSKAHKRFVPIHHILDNPADTYPRTQYLADTWPQPRDRRIDRRAGRSVAGRVEGAGHKLSGAHLPFGTGENPTRTTLAPDVGEGFPPGAHASETHGGGKALDDGGVAKATSD